MAMSTERLARILMGDEPPGNYAEGFAFDLFDFLLLAKARLFIEHMETLVRVANALQADGRPQA